MTRLIVSQSFAGVHSQWLLCRITSKETSVTTRANNSFQSSSYSVGTRRRNRKCHNVILLLDGDDKK